MAHSSGQALSNFEIENNIVSIDNSAELVDAIYNYNVQEQEALVDKAPWKKEYV